MSVSGYFGKSGGKLRLKSGDIAAALFDGQVVLEGSLSVEDASAVEARRAWRLGDTYESVAHYDPVLRSHCRLDGEGEEL